MLRLLYQVLLWLSLPAVLVRIEWRARREPEYGKRIGERMGRAPARVPRGCVWLHAVSAGETIAVASLIAELASEWPADGSVPCLVTTTTPTGSAEVTRRLGSAVHHCYAPYDFRFAVRSFFARVRPRLLVLVETELWPNLIGEAHRRGIPVLLVNARLSERSARGYRVAGSLTRRMLEQIGFVACQYGDHFERFKALGLRDGQGGVFGSVKFDARLPEDHRERVAALVQELGLGQARVWVAGSTHPGEDELVLQAHARVCARFPASSLLLVPRHPVRGEEVSRLARERGFTVLRHGVTGAASTGNLRGGASTRQPPPPATTATADRFPQVVVCETMGQLQTLYGLSEIAFLGGSLVPHGGHNPIEAALCGQPLVIGPHTHNFDEVVAAFAAAGCLTRVVTAAGLADAVLAAFADDEARAVAGARALQVVQANRGATDRLLDLLQTRIRAATA